MISLRVLAMPNRLTELDIAESRTFVYCRASGRIVRASVAFAVSHREEMDVNEIASAPTRQKR